MTFPEKSVLRRWLARLARWSVALLVLLAVCRRVWIQREQLAGFSHHFELGWLIVSGAAYLIALSTCALYWWRAIIDQGDRPGFAATWAAYFAGHLGKYVPGKGLVVVIRAGLLRDDRVSIATGAISCAHETLLMMAVGALVAAVLVPFTGGSHAQSFALLSLVAFIGLGTPILPPIVAIWSRWVTRPFGDRPGNEAYRCRWGTVAWGSLVIAGGWCLNGVSLACVLASIGVWKNLVGGLGVVHALGLVTASVALATVGGFVSFLPGGLGSREWILVEMLGPALGPTGTADAAVAALALRLVWLVTEGVGAALFWLWNRQCKRWRVVTN